MYRGYSADQLNYILVQGFSVASVFMPLHFREEILLQILKLKLQYDHYVLMSLQKTRMHLFYVELSVVVLEFTN